MLYSGQKPDEREAKSDNYLSHFKAINGHNDVLRIQFSS